MTDPSYVQSVTLSQKTQLKEFVLHLYLYQNREAQPKGNQFPIVGSTSPHAFGATVVNDWTIHDGPSPDAIIVARVQGLHLQAGMTASNWFICQNIVFTDDRLSGSTLKVMGNIQAGEGEWAIIGGTGEFAYAQGVASYKQMTSTPGGEVTRELQIRALCITLLKPPVPAVPTSTMPNPAEVLAPASSAPVPPARAVVVSTPDAVPMMYRKYGPWGSEKGKYFNMKTCDRITKVSVIYTSFIHTVQFSYIDRGINKSAQLGGQALPGSVVKEMSLEDGEYLRTFSGSTELIDGHARITSLSFGTNLRSYGRFGVEGRHSNFSITASNTNESIAYFFGWHESITGINEINYVNSVGVYLLGPSS
ncbi:uncharacterized protein LOC123450058 [Hordeum vulgare subsp. vulgare]|uniref:Dirigent protein n=1 Tax=Hordeum vulgare subsp. vulgare TaxID=112509 RepID=F2DMU8_HORVV|nr:uncharacterized protein LOC123450058 [Hordeum vulgare subsp. vulgare]BAJ96419.1 predicted protein [Hordeum vulgare subsp. vulgare]